MSKDSKTAKTPAERKAAERERRRIAGQVFVQAWVSKYNVERIKKYIARVEKHDRNSD